MWAFLCVRPGPDGPLAPHPAHSSLQALLSLGGGGMEGHRDGWACANEVSAGQ